MESVDWIATSFLLAALSPLADEPDLAPGIIVCNWRASGAESLSELLSMRGAACLAYSVDDVYWMGNDAEGYVVNVRWSIVGTHTGHGVYGTPTGRRVRMWGISLSRLWKAVTKPATGTPAVC